MSTPIRARFPVDLHAHSTFSDGRLTPTALLELAAAQGIHTFALTDHDTTDGLPEAHVAARRLGVRLIDGIEISAWIGSEIHVLGYFVDREHPDFARTVRERNAARIERVQEICRRLAALGAPIDPEVVLRSADGGNVGRPHIARVLVAAGHAPTIDEAFRRFLGRDAPAYVPASPMTGEAAIALIHAAGGVAVLAHPGVEGIDDKVPGLVAAGLDGLEAVHPAHDDAATRRYTAMARALGVVATGGADFHDPGGPTPPGGYGTWPETVVALEARRDAAPRRRAAAAHP